MLGAGARAMIKTNDTEQNNNKLCLAKTRSGAPCQNTLLREERDAGFTAAGARELEPLRAKRLALQRTGSMDGGQKLSLKQESR